MIPEWSGEGNLFLLQAEEGEQLGGGGRGAGEPAEETRGQSLRLLEGGAFEEDEDGGGAGGGGDGGDEEDVVDAEEWDVGERSALSGDGAEAELGHLVHDHEEHDAHGEERHDAESEFGLPTRRRAAGCVESDERDEGDESGGNDEIEDVVEALPLHLQRQNDCGIVFVVMLRVVMGLRKGG